MGSDLPPGYRSISAQGVLILLQSGYGLWRSNTTTSAWKAGSLNPTSIWIWALTLFSTKNSKSICYIFQSAQNHCFHPRFFLFDIENYIIIALETKYYSVKICKICVPHGLNPPLNIQQIQFSPTAPSSPTKTGHPTTGNGLFTASLPQPLPQ